MFKKGFVLVTALVIISSISVLVLMQTTFIRVLERKISGYYQLIQKYNQAKSERAYQEWLSRQ